MALQEHDRENLLRDGHTMSYRGELDIDGETLLVGFRSQGQLSLYIGADPVFQFNAEGQLRRVFFQGRRFAAEQRSLLELIRETRGGKVRLTRQPIDPSTLSALQSNWTQWLQKISLHVNEPTSRWPVAGEDLDSFRIRLAAWIEKHGNQFTVADSPHA